MESTEGDEGRAVMEISSSRAFSIAQMVSSRRVVAVLKSRSALSRMVESFPENCLIESIGVCGGWSSVWVLGSGRRLR